MWILKFSGCLLIAFTGTAYGFLKAHRLQMRAKQLEYICNQMCTLKSYLQMGNSELERLFQICFNDKSIFQVDKDRITVISGELLKEDKSVIEEFFSQLGENSVLGELERIDVYYELLMGKREQAKQNAQNEAKLWQTMGICIGLAGSIFLI